MAFDPEVWGTVADWVVAVTAVGAVWFGREQLKRVVQESARQADVARADLMLKIDQIFEGKEVGESRMAIRTLRNECEAEARAASATAIELAEAIVQSVPLFAAKLTELYDAYKSPDPADPSPSSDPPHVRAGKEYTVLMTLPYWMETVGLLTRKGLLHADDVLDLYDAVFVGTLCCFDAHIEIRRDERDPDRRFLENATWLRDKAQARNERRAHERPSRFV